MGNSSLWILFLSQDIYQCISQANSISTPRSHLVYQTMVFSKHGPHGYLRFIIFTLGVPLESLRRCFVINLFYNCLLIYCRSQSYKKRRRDMEKASICWLISQWPLLLTLGQMEARNQKLHLVGSPTWFSLAMLHCFSFVVSSELDQKHELEGIWNVDIIGSG